jgi:hypothetical protein
MKRMFFAAIARFCLALEDWQMKKADWLHEIARWADRKARGK